MQVMRHLCIVSAIEMGKIVLAVICVLLLAAVAWYCYEKMQNS